MNFKEFLKKEKFQGVIRKDALHFGEAIKTMAKNKEIVATFYSRPSIPIYRLGKWAWEYSLQLRKELDENIVEGIDIAYWDGNRQLMIEIAEACLGEKEIKKRLKELKV